MRYGPGQGARTTGRKPKPAASKSVPFKRQPRLNLAPPKPTGKQRNAAIQHHVDNYKKAPRQHAKALRDLGVPAKSIRQVDREAGGPLFGPHKVKQNPSLHHALESTFGNFTGSKLVDRTLTDLTEAAAYTPAGLYQAGKSIGGDVASTAKGKPTLRRTGKLGKAVGKGIVSDVRHPGRHPGNFLLDVAGVAAPVAGVVSRAAGTATALREGATIGKALTRASREGGSVLHAPAPGRRAYKLGDLKVEEPNSRNVLRRQAQKAHSRHLNARPGHPGLARRVGKSLENQGRTEAAVESAPAHALEATAHGLKRSQRHGVQTALRVVAEGKPIEERIRFHQEQKAAGVGSARDHARQIKLLELAKPYVENVKVGGRFEPRIRADAPSVGRLYGRLEKVGAQREAILRDTGQLPAEGAAARVNAPGRVIEGAKYERVSKRKGRVEQVREYPARSKTVTRARTPSEAKTRLAELDRQYAKMVDAVAKAGEQPGDFADLTRRRNMQAQKRARKRLAPLPTVGGELRKRAEDKLLAAIDRNPGSPVARKAAAIIAERDQLREALNEHALPTEAYRISHQSPDPESGAPMHELAGDIYPKDIYDKATQVRYYGTGQTALDRPTFALINKVRGNPSAEITIYRGVPGDVKEIRPGDWVTPNKQYAEEHAASESGWHVIAAKVRVGDLYTQGDSIHEWGWHPSGVGLGSVAETIPGKPRRVHLRELRERKAGGKLVGSDFAGGKVYVPYHQSEARVASGAARANGQVIGRVRSVVAKSKPFTGKALQAGKVPDNTTGLVARQTLRAVRYLQSDRLRQRILKAAHDERQGDHDILINDRTLSNPQLSPEVKALVGREHYTLDELSGHATAFEEFRRTLFPQHNPSDFSALTPEERLAAQSGGKVPGYKWVDERLLRGANKQARYGEGKITATVDEINNASKLAILYLKPAYALPNIAGNLFLNVVQQGPAAPVNLARAARLNARLGPDVTAAVDSVMGEGIAKAISSDAGKLQKTVNFAAGKWSTAVDLVFRRAAFLHEAGKLGYKTPERMRALLEDDAHHADRLEVAQRAKDAIIDYERLNEFERSVVRRVVFFYPWVKGSTRYTGHFIAEHPTQAAIDAGLARQGKEKAGLGPVPSYLEGSFKVGGKLVNPASAGIFGTSAQVEEALHGLMAGDVKQAARLSEFLTPAAAVTAAEVGRADSRGIPFKATASGGEIARKTLFDNLPQVALARRIHDSLEGKDQSKRLFPGSVGGALKQFAVGGVAPRAYNPDVLHDQARREQRALMSPTERTSSDFHEFYVEAEKVLKAHGVKQLPKFYAARLNLWHERASARASTGRTWEEHIAADLGVIYRHGWIDKQQYEAAKANIAHAPEDKRATISRELTDTYFDRDGLLHDGAKEMGLKLP